LQNLFGGVASASALEDVSTQNAAEHTDIRKSLDVQKKATDDSSLAIDRITTAIGKIEATQNRDIARKEARRLADDINSRVKAEQAYERLFELNLNRLSRGADPCGTLACE
jgi:mannitol-1-phosphate/altronate dehydrogenase